MVKFTSNEEMSNDAPYNYVCDYVPCTLYEQCVGSFT